MNQTARDFLIGLCSIVALVGLGVLLMRFGEINTSSRYLVTIPTIEASGLRPGSMVTFNGVKVGVVESTEPSGDPLWPVTIIIGIDEGRSIPSSVTPYSNSSLLGTGGTLALVAGVLAVVQNLPSTSPQVADPAPLPRTEPGIAPRVGA